MKEKVRFRTRRNSATGEIPIASVFCNGQRETWITFSLQPSMEEMQTSHGLYYRFCFKHVDLDSVFRISTRCNLLIGVYMTYCCHKLLYNIEK
jgi:hypothetical protein